MATGLPLRLDVPRLADQRVELVGRVPLARLERLATALAAPGGEAEVVLRFSRDAIGRALVEGRVQAELPLTCQRCLGRVDLPVTAGIQLVAVSDERAAAALPVEYEPLLLEGREADTAALVEDELLLAVPIVPMHPDPASCGPLAGRREPPAGPQDERRNPFAALAGLKERN
jgi:uncharacterized protein